MQTIPFYKPSIGPEEHVEVVDTLNSGWLTTGQKAHEFESAFSAYLKHKHAIAVNSCTAALHLALEAIGLKPGEGVLVPTMTFAATAEVVYYFRARPILVDCRASDFNMDVADAELRLREATQQGIRVAAVIPVHFGGQIGDIAGIRRLAQTHQLKIIEDAAHCCPAFYRDNERGHWKTVGTDADISCFSFYANKPITTGEGGMACTSRDDYAERMRLMSLHGISRDAWKRYSAEGQWFYEIQAAGFKYNLTDIAAAIGIHQLRKADRLFQRRKEIMEDYTCQLSNVEELILPRTMPDRIHSWHLYIIRLKLPLLTIDRAKVIALLKEAGVATSVHYLPLHMHPFYRDQFGYAPKDLPCAGSLYYEIISLPIYPEMTGSDVTYVCAQLQQVLTRHRRHAGRPRPRPARATISPPIA